MKNKKILIFTVLFILLIVSGYFFFSNRDKTEQQALQSTYDISKDYLLLRLRTDEILSNAKEYKDHSTWSKEMTAIIQDWNELEENSKVLEESATKESDKSALNIKLIQIANAYTAKEINAIYDKAPKFKGIATLAKHLGVDAKRAQLILNQAQDETTAEGWTEAGDTLQKLETTAVVIKDGCKVAGFVGGVVLTGGAAGLATAGTLTQVTTVVVGVDLALEVTEDGAQIALGDKNKVSSFVKDVRTVTEPIANVMTITNIPSNLGNAFGKFDSIMIGLEQFREAAQEGKVIGVDLTNFEYHPPFQVIRQTKYPGELTVAEMDKAEVEEWLESLNKKYEPMSEKEIVEYLEGTSEKTEQVKEATKEEPKNAEVENKKQKSVNNPKDIPNQIIRIVNVSGHSWMMDTCFSSTCWDNLAANPEEDMDLGGIYTLGKVYGAGEGFSKEFQIAQIRDSNALSEKGYKITLYFAIAPFEGPKNYTVDYGTWQNHSIEINANYGDEPLIEWDGNELKQVK